MLPSAIGGIPASRRLRTSEVGPVGMPLAAATEDEDARLVPLDKDANASAKAQAALAIQQQRFNEMVMERSELQREQAALDSLLLLQLKHDDEMLKEWIRLA